MPKGCALPSLSTALAQACCMQTPNPDLLATCVGAMSNVADEGMSRGKV